MTREHRILTIAILLFAAPTFGCRTEPADGLQVAVASNFANSMVEIANGFEKRTGLHVRLAFGSTGKHYAQIKNGAPYDAFFAADVRRPRLLEEEGLAVAGSRITYAEGRLVLWSSVEDLVDSEGRVLADSAIRFIAIANPELAPYGRAAKETLQAMGLWEVTAVRLVRGENISQSFQFTKSRNADLGFVAFSQIMTDGMAIGGSSWIVPDSLYAPIQQQAVLLNDSEAARLFMAYVRGEEAMRIMRDFGYHTP